MVSIIITLDALLEPVRSERLPDFAPAYTSTPELEPTPALKTSYMKTTKASWLQEVRQSHTAQVYGRDRHTESGYSKRSKVETTFHRYKAIG